MSINGAENQYKTLLTDCRSVVRLLDTLLKKNGFKANITGADCSKAFLILPELDQLPSCELSRMELDELGLKEELLESLLVGETVEGSLYESDLNERGILQEDDTFLVFDVGAIMVFLQRRILRKQIELGVQEKFELSLSHSLETEIIVESFRKGAQWEYLIDGKLQSQPDDSRWRIAIAELKGGEFLIRLNSLVSPWWILGGEHFTETPKLFHPDEENAKALSKWFRENCREANALSLIHI